MDKTQLEKIEARLLEERARVMEDIHRSGEAAVIGTDEDGDLTRYPTHPADEGTDTMEQEKQLALLSQESDRLTIIDDALLRLAKDPEAFGNCENCGQPIPYERLDLVPWTRFCLNCQTQTEGTAGA